MPSGEHVPYSVFVRKVLARRRVHMSVPGTDRGNLNEPHEQLREQQFTIGEELDERKS